MKRTRIILADEDRVLMDTIQQFLAPCYEVVGIFTNGEALVDAAPSLLPDVVILDIGVPKRNDGLSACSRIKTVLPKTKIIFLTMNQDRDTVGAAFRAGTSGYVLKTSAASELMAAIRQVLCGCYFATPSLTEGMIGSFVHNFKKIRAKSDITDRQKEILELLVEGRSMVQVATILDITPRTVAFHKYSMMNHLELRSSAELISYALKSRSRA